jgi:dolichol-phosphate mannosyltransferase
VRDLTGGFKCFRREVLETLDLEAIHADGYGFQIEMTYRAIKAGFSVEEVPILFRERRVGQSKMTARIAVEAVWKVPALKLRLR